MSKQVKMALAVAGLVSVQAVSALAEYVPNDAISQADFKVRQGAAYTNHRGGFIVPGYWVVPVVTTTAVYVPPAVGTAPAGVAVSSRQTYQSFSYEPGVGPIPPAPVVYTAPIVPRWLDPLYVNTPPKFYNANRKITGKDFGY